MNKNQKKDLKIYANAKPKFKPKCLTSNVKKTRTQKTSKTRSSERKLNLSFRETTYVDHPNLETLGK